MTTDSEQQITDNAIAYAKRIKKPFSRQFTDKDIYIPESNPVSVFMAGSAGAGKTEVSKQLLTQISENSHKILRIDPDELRREFKEYDGSNSYLFQGPISLIVEKIHDLALHLKQSFILDRTLSSIDVARKNIKRSISKKRYVQILYVYQEPMQA